MGILLDNNQFSPGGGLHSPFRGIERLSLAINQTAKKLLLGHCQLISKSQPKTSRVNWGGGSGLSALACPADGAGSIPGAAHHSHVDSNVPTTKEVFHASNTMHGVQSQLVAGEKPTINEGHGHRIYPIGASILLVE